MNYEKNIINLYTCILIRWSSMWSLCSDWQMYLIMAEYIEYAQFVYLINTIKLFLSILGY